MRVQNNLAAISGGSCWPPQVSGTKLEESFECLEARFSKGGITTPISSTYHLALCATHLLLPISLDTIAVYL